MIDVSWEIATDVGRVRSVNQDSAFAAANLFVVADGMGGHAGGEVASALVTAEFEALASAGVTGTPDILAALDRANDRILAAAAERADRRGMGTTAVGLALVGDPGFWLAFNIGDSRLYRLSDAGLEQLTVDHSVVHELLAAGHITGAEAERNPYRHVLTRALGSHPAPAADCWTFCPVPGETFLLCSDGLFRAVPHDTLTGMLLGGASAEALVAAANDAGGADNVTAIVVRVHDRSAATGWADPPGTAGTTGTTTRASGATVAATAGATVGGGW